MEANPGPLRPVPDVWRILCSNVRGLAWNLGDPAVSLSQCDLLLCSETLVSDIVTCQSCWFPDSVVLSCCAGGKMPRARGMAAYVRNGYGAFRQHKFECGCCEMLVFSGFGVRLNLYVFSLCRNPGLDDRIFDCLLASMAAVLAEDIHAFFLYVGDLNVHHQWLDSTTKNRHGVPAFDFATVSGCDQFVVGPTHARVGTLDLLMTDVPDLVRVAVVAPMSNSDYSSLSAVISMAGAVPNLSVSRKVFPKHQVNWNTVCGAIQDLPWRNIWLADNPGDVLNKHLYLLVGR